MFNGKTQSIYYKYLQLLSDFANEYADELPERTKVKFQKSLMKYYDAELTEAIKHEKFILEVKNKLFKRALKASKKLSKLPVVTEQAVCESLKTLGLQDNVTIDIMRLMLLGLSQDDAPPEDLQDVEDDDSDVEVVYGEPPADETVDEAPIEPPADETVDEAPIEPPVLDDEPPEEPPADTITAGEQKMSYWQTRRKNRRKTEQPTDN